jgi:hypothetical protein
MIEARDECYRSRETFVRFSFVGEHRRAMRVWIRLLFVGSHVDLSAGTDARIAVEVDRAEIGRT